jgi:hypothetical protein
MTGEQRAELTFYLRAYSDRMAEPPPKGDSYG